ncbi:DUF4221 family protein [Litoribacter ruber]|uniref:DUF4221 family protein n=1 Tax=Litoribacter ruber TaxID=702568 RepID=UPI001BDA4E23|nr:DUF4221 family protein [Litoribacter ruber]MBT0810094.1 DUF4221 family protein [Litoribacter ruber]
MDEYDRIQFENGEIRIDVSEGQNSYSRYKYWTNGNDEYLYAFDLINSKIDVFDWGGKIYKETVKFPDVPEMIGFTPSEFHVISFDSIYLADQIGRLFLISSKGELIQKFQINNFINDHYEFNPSNNNDNYVILNSIVYCRVSPFRDVKTSKSFYRSPFIARIDLNNINLTSYFGIFPEDIMNSIQYRFNDHKLMFSLGLFDENEILVSFRNSEIIHRYINQNLYSSKPIKSKYKSVFSNNKNNNKTELESMVEYGFYHNIVPILKDSIYFRIVVPSQELLDSNKKMNSAAHRPFSIQKLDKCLNLVSESFYESKEKKLSFLNFFSSHDSIFIQTESDNEDFLIFKEIILN